eukprot:4188821-Prymnesium_polylepis.1
MAARRADRDRRGRLRGRRVARRAWRAGALRVVRDAQPLVCHRALPRATRRALPLRADERHAGRAGAGAAV